MAFAEIKWDPCNHPGPFKIQGVSFNPDPPKNGNDFYMNTTGIMPIVLTSGKVHFDVYFEVAGIWIKSPGAPYDLDPCHMTTCPIPNGTVTIQMKVYIPSIVLHAHYKGKFKLFDQNKSLVTCIDWETDID